jgi:hypothetical protein
VIKIITAQLSELEEKVAPPRKARLQNDRQPQTGLTSRRRRKGVGRGTNWETGKNR